MNPIHRSPIWLTLLSIVMIVTAQQAAGAERTWTNAGGDSLWNNPLNWSTGVAPGSNDSVRLSNDCPDEPQNIILDDDAWLTTITCAATDNRHYTITPLTDQFIRLNSSQTITGTDSRTVDLTINADLRIGSEYLRVYCYGGSTTLSGNISPSPTEQSEVYILSHYDGRLVLTGSNTITHVYASTDSRVVAGHAFALGTYYRTAAAPKSLTLRQSLLLTGGMSPLLTLNLGGPLEIGIEENGDNAVILSVNYRMIGGPATLTRGENSTGDFFIRAAGSGTYTARWITMDGSALVMNNASGTIALGSTTSGVNGWISGPGCLICEEPSNTAIYSTNDYTGGTFIRGGTLSLKGDNRLPTNGAVTVESAGTFNFDGHDQIMAELHGDGTNRFTWATSYAPVTNVITELLSPGVDGPGTLTFTHSGCLILQNTTTSRFELDAFNEISDRIVFLHSVGHLDLGGTLEIANLGGMESGDYTLFELNGGEITGAFDTIVLPPTITGTVAIVDGNVVLHANKQHGTIIQLR